MNSDDGKTQDDVQPKSVRKAWKPLHLKVLDVPSNTNNGAGPRVQPGEAFNFYRNS